MSFKKTVQELMEEKRKKAEAARDANAGGNQGGNAAGFLALANQIQQVSNAQASFATTADVQAAQAAAELAAQAASDAADAAQNAAQAATDQAQDAADAAQQAEIDQNEADIDQLELDAAAEEADDDAEEAATDAEQATQDQGIAQNAANIQSLNDALAAEISSTDSEQATQDARLDAIELQLPDDDSSQLTAIAANALDIDNLEVAVAANASDIAQELIDRAAGDSALDARLAAVEAQLPDDDSALATAIAQNAAAIAAEISATDGDITTILATLAGIQTDVAANAAAAATNAAGLAAEIASTDAEQAAQDARLLDLEENRTIDTDSNITVFVAVPGAANEVAGDFNDIPSAMDELQKYRFTGIARGIVSIRAGEHQVPTSINLYHPQIERIRIQGVNPGVNTAITYSGDEAADLAQFKARFQSILVCSGTNNKVFNHTTTAGPAEIYYLGFLNESTTTSTYGIYSVSQKQRLTLVRTGYFGFRYGVYSADNSDVYALGIDILHCGLYGLYAVRSRIQCAQGSNGKTLIDTCQYFTYSNGVGSRIICAGAATRPNTFSRARSYASRCIYGGELHAPQTIVDGCGTCLQITHNSYAYCTNWTVTNNTSRLASVDLGSRAQITSMTGPPLGTNTQKTIRAVDMSHIQVNTANTDVIYSPLLDVEGNFNSIIT